MTVFTTPFSSQTNREDESRFLQNDTQSDFLRRNAARPHVSHSGAAHSDASIEEAIWNGILKDRSLGPKYQENLTLEVENGQVKLRGHVTKPWHSPLIADIAHRVEGVVWVKNELIADNTLQEMVIRALVHDEATAPYIFTVRSSFGWVRLSGLVPSAEIAKAAEGVVGFVPHVRGILSLPAVFSATLLTADDPEPARRALQPRLAAAVYQDGDQGTPREVGLVSQVILDPCSRLVGAIAVRLNAQAGERDERLVPLSAVEAANERGVWLQAGETVELYPPYERKRFPLPQPNWKLPFPYREGEVRWSI